jgi:hypothetical protein
MPSSQTQPAPSLEIHERPEEERSGRCGDDAGGNTRQQQHPESKLGRALQRRGDARVGRRHRHDRLHNAGVSLGQEEVDDPLVAGFGAYALAQVLEEDPEEHRAERQTQHRQRAAHG